MNDIQDIKPDFTELTLLRAFYAQWAAFHSIPRDRYHRRQQEMACQTMVDAHHALMLFYKHHAAPKLALAVSDSRLVGEAVNDALSPPDQVGEGIRKITMLEPELARNLVPEPGTELEDANGR